MREAAAPIVTVAIDTEEDNWGCFAAEGATTRNITHLRDLQDLFDRYGARPTYLVNRPPLVDPEAVEVLGALAGHQAVEIGTHCHPWNTPPSTGEGVDRSMMFLLPREANRGKIQEVTRLIRSELGVKPRSFRAGRWGFGTSVARALADEGYRIDCSVSPLIDWSPLGGPDYGEAPHEPYRFHPVEPLRPNSAGPMLELPTTVGFLRGNVLRAQSARRSLERSALASLRVVGLLDRAGLLARRWLSPEMSTGAAMVGVAAATARAGGAYLSMTFHSCTLLPGATPFVSDEHERKQFLGRCEELLAYCRDMGFRFRTLSEAAEEIAPELFVAGPGMGSVDPDGVA